MKILIVINDAKFFLSHRYDLAKGLQRSGYEVAVACPHSPAVKDIMEKGFLFFSIPLSRKGLNPIEAMKLIFALRKVYNQYKPEIIHHFSIKPIIFGSIAAKFNRHLKIINAPTGLGYVFTNDSFKAKILQVIVKKLYRFALTRICCLIFQNKDDLSVFQRLNLIKNNRAFIIRGSGIDLNNYKQTINLAENQPCLVILPARLLIDKGVVEFVNAARIVKQKGIQARFALVGDADNGNPASITMSQIAKWRQEKIVELWGWCSDMLLVYQQADIVCLPSYREGFPRVLLEAAATGKPIIATDAPGCREMVVEGKNGYLVPVKNSQILAEKIIFLAEKPELRKEMGLYSKRMVEENFSSNIINHQTLDIYKQLLKA